MGRPVLSRAQAARPDFDLTDANADAIDAICRRLDGLPLAIELAAARVRHLTPMELAGRLIVNEGGGAFRVLATGPRDAPDRQQTLRYAIDWSYDLLAPQEQALFRRLAVFVGGFTEEAAQAVVNSAGDASIDTAEGIAALVDQSLLQQEDGPDGASRYLMLETIRELALEHLAAMGEAAAVTDAHAAYFLSLAEQATPELYAERQQAWLERLQVEQANMRVALTRSEQSGDVAGALRLAAALWRFWHRRGYWEEGRSWLVHLLALSEGIDEVDLATRAAALTGAGWLAHYQNDFAAAQTSLQEGLECYRRLGRTDGLIEVLQCQSLVAHSLGEHRRAAELCEEAVAISRNLGDHARTAESLCNLSRATRELGDYARAAALAQEALVLHRAAGHRGGTAVALLVLGDVARDLGDVAEVRLKCEESLATFRELGDPLGEGFSLHNLAVAAHRDGNLELARSICEESLAIFRCLDVGGAMAEVLASLGPILDRVGEPALALDALTEALPLAWRVGPRWVVAAIVEGIAGVAAGQGQDLAAVELASGAAALRAAIGMPVRPSRAGDLERMLTTTRARLGAAPFALAQTRGQARRVSEVIAAALAVRSAAPALAAPPSAVLEPALAAGLSTRERDVLHLLVAGKSDRAIAAALYISPRTASKHVGAILAKLAVASRTEAAVLARQLCLV